MSTQDKSLWYKPGQVIPAEHYTGYSDNIHLAPCTDETGVLQLTDLKKGSAVEYQIDLPKDATYVLELRYSTYYPSPLSVILDGRELGILELDNTEYGWKNRKVDIPMKAGKHTLKLTGTTAFPVTLNWLMITE